MKRMRGVAFDEGAVDIDEPFGGSFEFGEGLLEDEAAAAVGAEVGGVVFDLGGGAEVGADFFISMGVEHFQDDVGDAAGEGLDEEFGPLALARWWSGDSRGRIVRRVRAWWAPWSGNWII